MLPLRFNVVSKRPPLNTKKHFFERVHLNRCSHLANPHVLASSFEFGSGASQHISFSMGALSCRGEEKKIYKHADTGQDSEILLFVKDLSK